MISYTDILMKIRYFRNNNLVFVISTQLPQLFLTVQMVGMLTRIANCIIWLYFWILKRRSILSTTNFCYVNLSYMELLGCALESHIGAIRRIQDFVDRDTLISVYNALIRPHFDYCSEVWDTLRNGLSNRLQKLQNRAARVVLGMSNDIPGSEALDMLGWEPLETRRAKTKAVHMYKVLNGLAPSSLSDLFGPKSDITEYDLRGSHTSLQLPHPKTEKLKKSFSYSGANLWNSLPTDLHNSATLTDFKNGIGALKF